MRRVPTDDWAIVKAWREAGENYSKAATNLNMPTSMVRNRVMGALKLKPKRYKPLGITGEEAYRRWLELGGDAHAAGRLARRMGANEDTLRAAIRRHMKRNGLRWRT